MSARVLAGRGPVLRRWSAVLVVAAWLVVLGLAWLQLLNHAYLPTKAARAPGVARLPPAPMSRILVFAHPHCPCTRATLEELGESLARTTAAPHVRVVFVTSGLEASDVAASTTVAQARRLPSVEVVFDETGRTARRHGATVSGEVLVFAPAGELLFQGGITPSRGHQGDAAGQSLLERSLSGELDQFASTPVYGCLLPLE